VWNSALVKNTLAKKEHKRNAGGGARTVLRRADGSGDQQGEREPLRQDSRQICRGVRTARLKAGVVEGKVIDAKDVLVLAKLPSKEELMSKLLPAG